MVGVVDPGERLQSPLDDAAGLFVVCGRERDVRADMERIRQKLRIVEPGGDRLGLTPERVRLLWATDGPGDEGSHPHWALASAEFECQSAPVVDPLAVGLPLPANGAVEGGLRIQLAQLGVVGASVDRAHHGLHECIVVEVERVCVGDLAPQPGATSRVGLELERALEEADLLVERVARGSQLG